MYPPVPPPDDPFSIPPTPAAPVAPEPAKINKALLLMALGLGLKNPRAGAGVLEGAMRGTEQKNIAAQRQYQTSTQQHRQALEDTARTQALLAERQRMFKTATDSLKEHMPELPDKDAYEQALMTYATLSQIRPNALRAAVPYTAPDVTTRARVVFDKLLKNPLTKEAFAADAMVEFDRDGDGLPEPVKVSELSQLAGMPILRHAETGEILQVPRGTPPNEFQQAMQIETEIFTTEKGHPPKTPKEKAFVYDKAQQRAKRPAPERQIVPIVIQTAEGPQILDRRAGTTRAITDVSGQVVQPAPTADMRNKVAARKLVQRSITAVEALSRKIITRVGPGQRAEAIKRGAEAVFGNDPEFRTYQDARTALAGNLAVAQQGSRPSDADIKAIWLPLVPDAYRDTAESAQMKWDLIRTMSLPEGVEAPTGRPTPPKNPFRPQ